VAISDHLRDIKTLDLSWTGCDSQLEYLAEAVGAHLESLSLSWCTSLDESILMKSLWYVATFPIIFFLLLLLLTHLQFVYQLGSVGHGLEFVKR